jgi:hypothetical protein
MRTARIGLVVGYSLIASGFAALFLVGRFFPDVGKLGFAIIFSLVAFLSGALALSVFGGSVVCATRSLYCDRRARTVGGYITVSLSVLSMLIIGALYIRGFVIGR